jgi:hypothetical protein
MEIDLIGEIEGASSIFNLFVATGFRERPYG